MYLGHQPWTVPQKNNIWGWWRSSPSEKYWTKYVCVLLNCHPCICNGWNWKALNNCDDCLQIFDEEILVQVSNHHCAVLLKNSRSHNEVWRLEDFVYIYICILIFILHTIIEHIFYHHEGTSLSSTTRRQTYTNPHILRVYSGRQACNCQWTQMGENQNAQNHHPKSMLNLNSTSLILTKKKQRLIPCVQVCFEISTNINGNEDKVIFANTL